MNYPIGKAEIVVGVFIVLCLCLFLFSPAQVKPVSEWSAVFDVDCECGNHLHVEPYDPEHYLYICNNCAKVYSNNWKPDSHRDRRRETEQDMTYRLGNRN